MSFYTPGFLHKKSGGAAPTTMSFVEATNSVGQTILGTANTAVGDLLVLWDSMYCPAGTAGRETYPTGFTKIYRQDTSTDIHAISYKIATSADLGAPTLTGMLSAGSGNYMHKILGCFRGDNPLNSVVFGDGVAFTSAGPPGAQTLTLSGLAVPLMAFSFHGASGAIATRTWNPAVRDGEIAGTNCFMGYKSYNVGSTPVNITLTAADGGNNNALGKCYIQVF